MHVAAGRADGPDRHHRRLPRLAAAEARPRRAPATGVLGGWLGRAAGCVLGKPVEKIPREGIREIAEATGNWPIRGWFTAEGLPDEVAERWPWNRRSAVNSLAENIDGIARGRRPQLPAARPVRPGAARPRLHHRRRGQALAGRAAGRPHVHRRAGRVPQPAGGRRAAGDGDVPQPVQGVDRRADQSGRVRLGQPRRSGAPPPSTPGATPGSPTPRTASTARCSSPPCARPRWSPPPSRRWSRPGCRWCRRAPACISPYGRRPRTRPGGA